MRGCELDLSGSGDIIMNIVVYRVVATCGPVEVFLAFQMSSIEAVMASETFRNVHHTTRRHLRNRCRENLKSYRHDNIYVL